MSDDLIARLRHGSVCVEIEDDRTMNEAADALEAKDRLIADLEADCAILRAANFGQSQTIDGYAARIAILEAALEDRHRHHLELELRCRDLEAEKQAFKDGNKRND